MLPPRIAEHGLRDIVADKLDQILDAVHEHTMRHERCALLLGEDQEHGHADGAGDQQPEGIDRQAELGRAHDRRRIERGDELAHRIRYFGKGFAHDDYFPSLTFKTLSV